MPTPEAAEDDDGALSGPEPKRRWRVGTPVVVWAGCHPLFPEVSAQPGPMGPRPASQLRGDPGFAVSPPGDRDRRGD